MLQNRIPAAPLEQIIAFHYCVRHLDFLEEREERERSVLFSQQAGERTQNNLLRLLDVPSVAPILCERSAPILVVVDECNERGELRRLLFIH